MCKILSCLCVSILLLGVTSCSESERAESDAVPAEDVIVREAAGADVIVSVGNSKFTTQHIEWMQPNADPKVMPRMADWWLTNELFYAEAVKQGLGDEDKAAFLMDLTKKQIYAKALIEKTQNDIQVSDDEILAHYEENKNTNPRFKNLAAFDFVHVQTKTFEDANSVAQRIRSGESAEEVAKRLSIARDAAGGGVIKNYASRTIKSRFGDGFLRVLSTAEIGQVIGPVRLPNGTYEIAVLNGKVPASIKTFEEVKEQIKTQLSNKAKADAYKNLVEGLKAAAADKIVESEMLKGLRPPALPTPPTK